MAAAAAEEEEAGAGAEEEEEGWKQRRGGGRGGVGNRGEAGGVGKENGRRGEEIRWLLGCWAALMGLFSNSGFSSSLFFFSFRGI